MTPMAHFSVTCMGHGALYATCVIVEPTARMHIQNCEGNGIKLGSC